jgi:hypothetical protein
VNDYLNLVPYFDSVGVSHQENCLWGGTPLEYRFVVSSVGHCLVVHKLMMRGSLVHLCSLGFIIETPHSRNSINVCTVRRLRSKITYICNCMQHNGDDSLKSVSIVRSWQCILDWAIDVHGVRCEANKWRFIYPSMYASL